MLFEPGETVAKKIQRIKPSKYKVNVKVEKLNVPVSSKTLYQLIQSNCLVGPQDTIPGINDRQAMALNRFPNEFNDKILEEIKFEKMTDIYAHDV